MIFESQEDREERRVEIVKRRVVTARSLITASPAGTRFMFTSSCPSGMVYHYAKTAWDGTEEALTSLLREVDGNTVLTSVYDAVLKQCAPGDGRMAAEMRM